MSGRSNARSRSVLCFGFREARGQAVLSEVRVEHVENQSRAVTIDVPRRLLPV